jgi:hypothetical protein
MNFGFLSEDRNSLYIYKNGPVDLSKANELDIKTCADRNLFVLKGNLEPFFDVRGLMTADHPLFQIFDKDFLYFTPLDGFTEGAKKFDFVGWMISLSLHEQFHLHTIKSAAFNQSIPPEKVKSSLFSPRTVIGVKGFSSSECFKPGNPFFNVISKDIELFRNAGFIWGSLKDKTLVKKLGRNVIQNRSSLKGTEYDACWDQIRDLERNEGTATYFAIQNGIMRDSEFAMNPMDANNPDTFNSEKTGFWYITGTRLCKLANLLDPSDQWQSLIKSGLAPDEALAKILEKQ